MNKLNNHFPHLPQPPFYIKIHNKRKNDETNQRGRACPSRHERTTRIKENHYTNWS